MTINGNVTLNYDSTVKAVYKLVRQYIESGELRDHFDAFDGDEIAYGNSYEMTVLLGGTKSSNPQNSDAHGSFAPNGFQLSFSTTIDNRYQVTMTPDDIMACMTGESEYNEYAAKLTQTLYQGWIDDKNAAIYDALDTLMTSPASKVTVTLGTDVLQFARDMIATIKAKVNSFREGVTPSSYGNTTGGTARNIAARRIAIVMSHDLAATLDANGYAQAFNAQYLETADVVRIATNRLEGDSVLVTDVRNVQVHPRFEALTHIPNPDGGENIFYKKKMFVEAAKTGTQVAFPYVVIETTEEA